MEKEKSKKTKEAKNGRSEVVPEKDSVVRINFRIPSKLPSVYATHFFVQETPDEVVLSFFEVIHPILPPEDGEERTEHLKVLQGSGVVAECVSRVTVAKHKFPGFAQAMATTAERIVKEFESFEENANNQSDNKKN
ncbi:MAG: hypothetical protein LC778_03175 [Acidobacteria bacterium]|nr:hypothetical protein [Acidobacteriota bacterium]